jgi:hypothetical protein
MTSLFQGPPLRDETSHVYITLGTGAPDHYHNGLPYEASGALCGENGSASYYHQGLGFTSNGRVSMAGGAAVRYNSGAMPLTNANRISSGILPVDHYSCGVAYNSGHKVIFDRQVPTTAGVTNNGIPVTNNGEVVTNG